LDTTRTPFKTVERILGGSASYFSFCASFFNKVGVIAVVGSDFPEKHWRELEDKDKGIDLSGVQRKKGKTFHFDSSYSFDLYARTANKTELGVYSGFKPVVPDHYKYAEYVYLGTTDPKTQLATLKEFPERKIAFMDTIGLYIKENRKDLLKVLGEVDGFVLNDEEARMLCDTPHLLKAGRKIREYGPRIVIIKKGEHGCLVFHEENIYAFPAFPLEDLVDPTGAGDSFAGGLIGQLSRERKINETALKRAVAYASVMGSFVCEDYGLDPLKRLDEKRIEERFNIYRNMTNW